MDVDPIALSSLPNDVIVKASRSLVPGQRAGAQQIAVIEIGDCICPQKVELTFLCCVPISSGEEPFWAPVRARRLS